MILILWYSASQASAWLDFTQLRSMIANIMTNSIISYLVSRYGSSVNSVANMYDMSTKLLGGEPTCKSIEIVIILYSSV